MEATNTQLTNGITGKSTSSKKVELTVFSEYKYRLLKVQYRNGDSIEELSFGGDPARLLVYTLLFNQKEIHYKPGVGIVVNVSPRIYRLLQKISTLRITWSKLIESKIIPFPSIAKIEGALSLLELVGKGVWKRREKHG